MQWVVNIALRRRFLSVMLVRNVWTSCLLNDPMTLGRPRPTSTCIYHFALFYFLHASFHFMHIVLGLAYAPTIYNYFHMHMSNSQLIEGKNKYSRDIHVNMCSCQVHKILDERRLRFWIESQIPHTTKLQSLRMKMKKSSNKIWNQWVFYIIIYDGCGEKRLNWWEKIGR